ncbi:DUF6087 family protein [Streptomyces sp. AcE210]|uniref:DUF6087 family protein n=1 Tax=Streptomyces sp. AcE210 TaxID=2292703 RepID=UPI001F0CBE45|nr:DUF6087 family protein [Streptomyces sp. AcE210]
MNSEEPLETWARKREERRERARGRLRAVPLTEGPHRGTHVDPGAPRAIQEFNGTEWVTVSIADSLDAAKAILYPPGPVEERPVPGPALGRGQGPHRRTAPPKDATS